MKQYEKEILNIFENLCIFLNDDQFQDTYLLEYIILSMGVKKDDYRWDKDTVNEFKSNLKKTIISINRADIDEIEAELGMVTANYSIPTKIILPSLKLKKPSQTIVLKIKNRENIIAPFLMHNILILMCKLGHKKVFRVCKDSSCDNLFASIHKRKKFCSVRCRGRYFTRQTRHRNNRK